MKRFTFLILVLLFLPTASAQVMHQLNTTIDIHEDGTADVGISFRFNAEEIKEVNLPLSGDIYDLETTGGECMIKEEIENILSCRPPSPFMVGSLTVNTKFKAKGIVEKQGNISYFSFDVPILWYTERIIIITKLPAGMVVSEDVLLPISPPVTIIGSDGRRIFTEWSFFNNIPGNLIPIRIYYEPLTPQPPIIERSDYVLIIVILVIAIVSIVFIYNRKISKRSELVLSVLNENERMIVDIMKRMKNEETNQRKIVSLSGFSKAKVSRVIRSLEKRGVVKVERIGRRNRISLKKRFIED